MFLYREIPFFAFYNYFCLQAPPLRSGTDKEVTMCKKYEGDVFHFCNCFDEAGNNLTNGNDLENTNNAYYACCNCPGEIRDQYSVFKVLHQTK